MVRKTLELFECDVCGREGVRYQIIFEEGTRILDRCTTHAKKIEALKDEPGEWQVRGTKASFRKSSISEIRAAVAAGGNSVRQLHEDRE